MRNRHFILILFSVISQMMFGQVSFKAQGPDMVKTGEDFHVQFVLTNADADEPNWPSFDGFKVKYGPGISQSQFYQNVNGHSSSSRSITYTFTLSGQKAGTYTIQPARANVGGRTYKTQPLKIQVVGNASSRHTRDDDTGNARKAQGGKVFITATASRTNVYEQEAILLTYKIYFNTELSDVRGELPTLDGFQIQKLDASNSQRRENVNGSIYGTAVLNQYIVFPQKSGKLVIPPVTFTVTEIRNAYNPDPYDPIFNSVNRTRVEREVVAPSITLNVTPLPEKPDGFSGAVGQFSIESSLSPQKLKTNEALTLKITVTGYGNMKLIETPKVAFPKKFETYDAKVTENLGISDTGYSGHKVFEYLAVPRIKGQYTIPPVDFIYFDTESHAYKTVSTQPYKIDVEQGESSGSAESFSNQKEEDDMTDIFPIKTGELSGVMSGCSMINSIYYWLVYVVAIMVALTVIIIGRKRIRENSNVIKVKGRNANKVAIRRLKNAARLLQTHDVDNFYEEVMRALLGYTEDKLNIPMSTLTKDNIQSELISRNVSEELIDVFIKCLNDCEFARYAPGDSNENMENVYEHAVSAITDMEDSIKKNRKYSKQSLVQPVVVIVMLLCASDMCAQSKSEADSLYFQEEYEKASAAYLSLLQKHSESSDLYYNIANCYYRMDSLPKAVLYYERAYRLSPGDDKISSNLSFVRTKINDKYVPHSELFFVTWWKIFSCSLCVNAWLIFALILFVVMLIGFLVYVFLHIEKLRKIALHTAFICLFLSLLFNLCAIYQYRTMSIRDSAIIIRQNAEVKSTPSSSSSDLFVLHGGAKVRILDDSMKEWVEVCSEENKAGWIERKKIEII